MKKVAALLCAVLLLVLACTIPAYADEIMPENETEYGYYGTLDLNKFPLNSVNCKVKRVGSYSSAYYVFDLKNSYLEQNGYRGYTYTHDISPVGTTCEQIKYAVVMYRNIGFDREIGLVWRTSEYYEGFNTDNPAFFSAKSCTIDGWKYAIVELGTHEQWTGKLYGFGISLYADDISMRNQEFCLKWIKFFTEDPTELYAPETLTDEDMTEPPIEWPTDPYETQEMQTEQDYFETERVPHTEREPQTEWESFTVVDDHPPMPNRGGIFFELLDNDMLTGGCQKTLLGCQEASLGCRGGSCYSVTGGIFAICLLGAAWMFRKKE